MHGHLAIVVYRAIADGMPTGSLDFQVRWFSDDDPDMVREQLLHEPFHKYKNPYNEEVSWELVEVMDIEAFNPNESGDEVAGFIASLDELSTFA